MRAVALQHGPGKTLFGGVGRVPGEELPQRPVIGAAGVGARQRVEHELDQRRRRDRDQRGVRTSLPGSSSRISVWAGAAAGKGRAGVLLGPQLFEQVGDPAVDRARRRDMISADGRFEGRRWWTTSAAGHRRGKAVARQDPFPAPAEAGAVAPAAVVAAMTEPAAVEGRFSAGAAQRDLRVRTGGQVTEGMSISLR